MYFLKPLRSEKIFGVEVPGLLLPLYFSNEHQKNYVANVLSNKTKNKTDKIGKIVKTNKQEKKLIYNTQHSLAKFKDIIGFKDL